MNKLLIYLLILPFLFFLLTPISHLLSPICYAYPPGWSDDILINENTSDNHNAPDVSTDKQNNVWLTWHVATWTEGEIYYSKRDSLGNCLLPETTVSNNVSKSWKARVVLDNSGNVHFVWRDESPQGYGIWYAKLANDGSEIVSSHLVVSGAGGLFSSLIPEIALNKYQEINIIWDELPSGYNQMNYTKLDSLGNTLIAKIQVSPVGFDSYWPGIGVDSFANNHLACRTDSNGISDRLTYSKLDKDGNILVANKILGFGSHPTIIADQNQNIHMVYGDPTGSGSRIEYLKLDNNGNILIGPKTISLPQINSNSYAHMAIDSLQYLHIVWQVDSFAHFDIMYTKMDTSGNFLIPAMKVVYPYPHGGREPRIAVDRSNRLHLVWISTRLGSEDIFYKRGENEMTVEETARIEVINLPKLSVFPNPFRQMTEIRYEITEYQKQEPRGKKQDISLKIYDVSGRLIRSFPINQLTNSPINQVSWRGDDDSGRKVPAGVYFVHITSATMTQTIPVVLLR